MSWTNRERESTSDKDRDHIRQRQKLKANMSSTLMGLLPNTEKIKLYLCCDVALKAFAAIAQRNSVLAVEEGADPGRQRDQTKRGEGWRHSRKRRTLRLVLKVRD
jgi:hypothetical protein